MTDRFTFRMADPTGARFAPRVVAGLIGQVAWFNLPDQPRAGRVKVIAAELVDDGAAVMLTVQFIGAGE